MEVKFKIYNDDNSLYKSNYDKYVEDFYSAVSENKYEDETSDPVLRDLLRSDKDPDKKLIPAPPEPPVVYVKGKIKNDLIMGYHVLPDKAGIRLMLDYRLVEQSTAIIKYDDKIIQQLNSILD